MSTLVTIVFGLVFFVLIVLSVLAHEFGHFLPGKLFGVRAPEFFVGFGPKIWSMKRGETEYGFKWIVLGGYTKLLGMYPPRRPEAKRGRLQDFADAARAAEWEDITPEDVMGHRLVYQQKTWKKLAMMAGGITMNVVISFLCFQGIALFHGNIRATTTVGYVRECVLRADAGRTDCQAGDPSSPAAQSGIKVGDVIVSFNGTAIADNDQLVDLIRGNLDGPATLVVRRDGQEVTLPTVHTVVNTVSDQLDPTRFVQAGWFGVSPTAELRKEGPVPVLKDMWTMTKQSVTALVALPVKTFNVIADLVAGKPRDPYSPMSIVGASTAAGQVAASDQVDLGEKTVLFASLLGAVNLFLALFNLVPLPPMDGGHIASAIFEWVRRGIARLLGRPDPGPADTAKMLPVAYVVGAFVLLCGLALIVADIISPIKIL